MPTPPVEPQHLSAGEDQRDLDLIAAIRLGDRASWTTLIQRYQDRLFTVCLRMVHNRELAADLTQDSFVKLIQGLEKYDGRSKFSTWAIRVTMNVCLSKLRAEKLRRHASLDAPDSPEGQDGTPRTLGERQEQTREPIPGSSVEYREDRASMLRALQVLEADQRAILVLRDGRGLEYDQIAEVLGVPVGTIKSRLFRARQALRDAVEKVQRDG